ncbi:MarR family winged helix-turn-helix transcriptional regulator [Paraflavitalea sp. CAU 1676]|uniref:MarR family winged helix-turn-helix transcriptional regulator n=1 Tax=Paraflavitalea sp. CAU 1676 TaxID=3032598 RepID=UPI0023DAAFEB|nr:MarR family winged helix-turn-helix transcriptional regulator [Paraflavitalea sp. CAU 1676]MDF2192064.1 MarR family winged helix-turn-helix transcriptional regulator [Paraflavitalea sp. CAU 1676]
MNFYESLGFLVFGSRLRRLSETFLGDVNRIYEAHNLTFDAAWFPVFYILSRKETVSIRDIADELLISHSSVSQLVSALQQKGLVKTTADPNDARRKVVAFTPKGKKLQQQIAPVWTALSTAMEQLVNEGRHSKQLLKAIGEMESGMAARSLFDRVEQIMNHKD